MRVIYFAVLVAYAATGHAAGPLTVDACRTMKTEAMRQQCLLSAVNTPPNIAGKTYSTRDAQQGGPLYIDQSAPSLPIAPVVPYIDVSPNGRQTGPRSR